MENLTNSELQYAEAVKQSITSGRINGAFRMALIKKGRELAIPQSRCSEIEQHILSECPVSAQPPAAQKSLSAEREERKRLAELERKQEDARREAQRLEEARRRAEEDVKREREMAEQARKRREEEERADRERREKEHQQQMAEQERLRMETEKAAAAKLEAERALREASEAKAAAELAKKEAELKSSQAKMQSQLSEQQNELERVKAAMAGSPQKRWLFIVLGLFGGWLGLHLAYARRWVLFALFWVSEVAFFVVVPAGAKSSPVQTPFALAVVALWIGGTFFIKKDGKKRRLS